MKGLRTEKVTLYDCNKEKDKRKAVKDVTRKDFRGPWPATRDPASPLYLKVQVERTEYCVRAFAVETDKTVAIEKDMECRAMVAGQAAQDRRHARRGRRVRRSDSPPRAGAGAARARGLRGDRPRRGGRAASRRRPGSAASPPT